MAKNTSVILGDHFVGFIDEQIAKGRYTSASEVVRDGLRLLEERNARIKALQTAIDAGEASGIAEDFSWDDVKAKGRARSRSS